MDDLPSNEEDALSINAEYQITVDEAIDGLLAKGIFEQIGSDITLSDEFEQLYTSEIKNLVREMEEEEQEESLTLILTTALIQAYQLMGYQRIHRAEFKALYNYLDIIFDDIGGIQQDI